MKIEIKKQNYKQLVQCVYLGNLVINEYQSAEHIRQEYSEFMQDLLLQIVSKCDIPQAKFELKSIPYEKNQDNLLSDLYDMIEDSVKEYYEEYRHNLFDEMLVEKLQKNMIV